MNTISYKKKHIYLKIISLILLISYAMLFTHPFVHEEGEDVVHECILHKVGNNLTGSQLAQSTFQSPLFEILTSISSIQNPFINDQSTTQQNKSPPVL